jgi:hypothetical protein
MRKFFFVLSLLATLSALTTVDTKAFSDIKPDSELAEHIEYLRSKGVVSGYPDGSFKPRQTINRAEALKIIFKTLDEKPFMLADPNSRETVSFPDVKANQWFAPYVATAKMAGVVSGYPDGTFRPDQTVNRAEFVKMAIAPPPFARRLNLDAGGAVKQFSDVDGSQWYAPFVSAALELKFLPQTKQFKPTAGMQRQEAVEMMYFIARYLELHPQAAAATSQLPYVPEEAFVKNDPTVEHSYHPEEFGPDKLFVKKDINKTAIENTYAGYSLEIDEIVDVENFERSPERMTLTYARGCVVDIERRETNGQTPEDIFQKIFADANYMNPPEQKTFTPLKNIKAVKAYQLAAELDGQRNEFTMIYNREKYYLINAFSVSGSSEAECDRLNQTITSNFSIL